MTASPPALPLLKFAARCLPGGLETFIVLASLSDDERVRTVADRWNSLPSELKRIVEIETLCHSAGIASEVVFGKVAATAFELGIDTSGLIGRAMLPADPEQFYGFVDLSAPLERNWRDGLHFGGRRGPSKRAVTGHRVESIEAHQVCAAITLARKNWGLSQDQFAGLFMTTVRTVRRWEARQFSPTDHQLWFLHMFVGYVARHGLRRFLRRFVREERRYGKPGRPTTSRSTQAAV